MKEIINYIIRFIFLIYSIVSVKKRVLFLPHPGMVVNDKYSIINYRSDCALSLANYILENKLLNNKILTIAISKQNDINKLLKYISANFPNRKIDFIYSFDATESKRDIINRLRFYKAIAESSHVFTSITYFLRPLLYNKNQEIVDLGYFSCPFKNDIFSNKSALYMNLDKISERDCRYYVCASELSIRLILPSMSIKYENFLNLGMCRNDYLFSNDSENSLRNEIINSVQYYVRKIILYTPTHRDYENSKLTPARELLGFDADLNAIDDFLSLNGYVIICKLHPKQNKEVIKKSLPKSIILHEPNDSYGLAELMKISDALVTDYTSGYFDYLILDKPVIFNFYDIAIYKNIRGFTFEPIESICAGDIINDENSFINALSNIDNNYIVNKQKRQFVRDLVFTHQDTNSCKRVFNYFFQS